MEEERAGEHIRRGEERTQEISDSKRFEGISSPRHHDDAADGDGYPVVHLRSAIIGTLYEDKYSEEKKQRADEKNHDDVTRSIACRKRNGSFLCDAIPDDVHGNDVSDFHSIADEFDVVVRRNGESIDGDDAISNVQSELRNGNVGFLKKQMFYRPRSYRKEECFKSDVLHSCDKKQEDHRISNKNPG